MPLSWVYNRQCLFNMTHEAVSTYSCMQRVSSVTFIRPLGTHTASPLLNGFHGTYHLLLSHHYSITLPVDSVIRHPARRSLRLEAEETAKLRHKTSFPACPTLPVIRLLPSHGCMDQLELAINDQSLRCLSMRANHAICPKL